MTPDPLFDLNGRGVVITGGLGQLGRQFARTVADRGGRALIFDLPSSYQFWTITGAVVHWAFTLGDDQVHRVTTLYRT